jgi:hypothetical protein
VSASPEASRASASCIVSPSTRSSTNPWGRTSNNDHPHEAAAGRAGVPDPRPWRGKGSSPVYAGRFTGGRGSAHAGRACRWGAVPGGYRPTTDRHDSSSHTHWITFVASA